MREKSFPNSRLLRFNDNNFVDLLAAIITGFGLCWLDLSSWPLFLGPLNFSHVFQSAVIRVGAFVLVALGLFLWKHQLRVRWGWLLIAILGLTVVALIDEMIYRATAADPEFFSPFSPFPMEIVLFLVPTLLLMGGSHCIGQLVLSRRRRYM